MKWLTFFSLCSASRPPRGALPCQSDDPVVALMALNAPVLLWLMRGLDGFLERDGDRALFDLTPKPHLPNGGFRMKTRRIPVATLAGSLLAVTLITPWAFAQDPDAQFNLAVRHATGDGVLKDAAEAARLFRLAAAQGHAEAQVEIGLMYVTGQGVTEDYVLAHMWLNIAGANGHEAAGAVRDRIESDLTPAEIRRATDLARTCMASDYQECEPADEVVSANPASAVREPEAGTIESSSLYFTRGSHRDDVLRIQGTPTSINQYSDHEVWGYGLSGIDISLRDGRVTGWNNLGRNLKVRLNPGPNVTDEPSRPVAGIGEGTGDGGGDGVYQGGPGTGISEPVVISRVQPEYSEEARKARVEGVVRLDAIIHQDGSIQILRVLRSLGFGLDEKAIEALEQWKFRPGMRAGEPVAVSMNIEVIFNLRR